LSNEAMKPDFDLEKTSNLILTLTFYWYNFMPLSRGSAACGFICLLGMFLALGIEITSQVIQGQQVDWEGILNPRADNFIDAVSPWMYPSRKSTKLLEDLEPIDQVFPTFRAMIQALNSK